MKGKVNAEQLCVLHALADTSLIPSRLTVAVLMLDMETEWTLNALLTRLSSYRKCSKAPDIRPLSANDISAANRRHAESNSHSPWFRLWQRYGVCCRS